MEAHRERCARREQPVLGVKLMSGLAREEVHPVQAMSQRPRSDRRRCGARKKELANRETGSRWYGVRCTVRRGEAFVSATKNHNPVRNFHSILGIFRNCSGVM